jgi:hypothetical protein
LCFFDLTNGLSENNSVLSWREKETKIETKWFINHERDENSKGEGNDADKEGKLPKKKWVKQRSVVASH